MKNHVALFFILLLAFSPTYLTAAKKKKTSTQKDSLAEMVAKYSGPEAEKPQPGSLWTPDARFNVLASDDKARKLHDLVMVVVTEQFTATQQDAVNNARATTSTAGITSSINAINQGGKLSNLFGTSSNATIVGQGQTSSASTLSTTIAGEIVAVLPNGVLVVEAEKDVFVTNQKQHVVLRGRVRPNDIGPDNSILTSSIAGLELDVKGKGVVSDFTRPPNKFAMLIMKLLGF